MPLSPDQMAILQKAVSEIEAIGHGEVSICVVHGRPRFINRSYGEELPKPDLQRIYEPDDIHEGC